MAHWKLILVSLSIFALSQALTLGDAASITANEVCKDDSTDIGGLVKRFPTLTTHKRPYPTITSNQRPFCFREHNEHNEHRGYLSFDAHELKKALETLCGHSSLSPTDGWWGYVSPEGLVAWGAYAKDQSGCSKKSSFDFINPCMKYMTSLIQACDGPASDMGFHGYGGGFVQSGPGGCIEYYIAKPPINAK
jgi:hypothetical protein